MAIMDKFSVAMEMGGEGCDWAEYISETILSHCEDVDEDDYYQIRFNLYCRFESTGAI